METQRPVIRTYSGTDREAAKAAYQVGRAHGPLRGLDPGRTPMAGGRRPARAGGDLRALASAARARSRRPSTPDGGASVRHSRAPRRGRSGHRGRRGPSPLRPGMTQLRPAAATGIGGSAARAHARATLETIDLHGGGEPIRLDPLRLPARAVRAHPGAATLGAGARRRRAPRCSCTSLAGHRDMYGAVLLPPYRDDADIAVLFMHNEGYSTMCGHGIIALTTGLIEEGLYPADACPPRPSAGRRRRVWSRRTRRCRPGEDGGPEVRGVRFTNVPSYLPRDRTSGCPLDGRRPGHGAARVRRRLLRHRRRGRPRAARGAARHRRADRVPAPPSRMRCAATTRRRIPPTRTWASSTARSSSTTTRRPRRTAAPRPPRSAT